MESEIWRPVPSLPGLLASTLGRLMVAPYTVTMARGGVRVYGGTPSRGSWAGHRYLYRFRGRTYKAHRLVCEAFHGPAPKGKPGCLHSDENARNNRPHNLAWGTQKENLNAPGFLAYCRARVGGANPRVIGRKRVAA
jgi:hypothetical protein